MYTQDEIKKYKYDAFISYNCNDINFARRLKIALEGYKPPKGLGLPARKLIIFIDFQDITGTELDISLRKSIVASKKLIVICSPDACESKYVNDEIRWFAENNATTNIIPILFKGNPNNEIAQAEKNDRAFPEALCELKNKALASDYRNFGKWWHKIKRGQYSGPWNMLLANITDKSREEIEERNRKEQNRKLKIAIGIVSFIMIIFILLTIYALRLRDIALKKKNEAQNQLNNTNYNLALLQKKKAVDSIKNNQWQLTKLYAVNSLLYQKKAGKTFPMDIGIPLDNLDWNLQFNKTLKHEGDVNTVLFEKSREYIISGSNDKLIKIWDYKSGGEIGFFIGHKNKIKTIGISKNGNYLVSGGNDKTLCLWKIIEKKIIVLDCIYAHEEPINSIFFSPDNTYFITASNDKTIKKWTIENNKLVMNGYIYDGRNSEKNIEPKTVGFNVDGKYLAYAGNNGRITILDIQKKISKTFKIENSKEIVSLCFSPDGKYMASGDCNKLIYLWNTRNLPDLTKLKTINGHSESVTSLSFGKDYTGTDLLISGSRDQTIKFWDISDNTNIKEILSINDHFGNVYCLNYFITYAFNSGLNHIISGGGDGIIMLHQLSKLNRVNTLGRHLQSVDVVTFTPDYKKLLSVGSDSSVKVWDIKNLKLLNEVKDINYIWIDSLNIISNGIYLLAKNKKNNFNVLYFENQKLKYKYTLDRDLLPSSSIEKSPDGKYLASLYKANQMIKIWEINKNKIIKKTIKFNGKFNKINFLCFTPNSKYLAIADRNSIKLLDIKNSQVFQCYNNTTMEIFKNSFIFSSDCKYFASIVDEGNILELYRKDQQEKWEKKSQFIYDKAFIKQMNFKPDTTNSNSIYIATACSDNSVIIIQIDKQNLQKKEEQIIQNSCQVKSMKFSPDGKYFIIFLLDGSLKCYSFPDMKKFITIGGLPNYKINSFDINEKIIAVGLENGKVIAWELENLFNFTWEEYKKYELYKPNTFYIEDKDGSLINRFNNIKASENKNIGAIYERHGDREMAIKFYENEISKNDKNYFAYLQLGNLYFKNGKNNRAEIYYKKAFEVKNDLVEAYKGLGDIYFNFKNSDNENVSKKKALFYYNKALKTTDIRTFQYLFKIGKNLKLTYKSEAKKFFEKSIEFNPNYFDALKNLGILLYENNDIEKGIEILKKALRIKPDSLDAKTYLNYCLEKKVFIYRYFLRPISIFFIY